MSEARTCCSTPSTREGCDHRLTPSPHPPHSLTGDPSQAAAGRAPGRPVLDHAESCPQSAAGSPHQAACAPPRGGLSRPRGRDRAASPEDKSVRGRQPSAPSAAGLRHAPPAQCPLEGCEAWSAQRAGLGQHGRHPPRHRGRHVPSRELGGAERGPPCAHVRARLRVRCPPRAGHLLLCEAGCSPLSSPLPAPGGNRPGPRLCRPLHSLERDQPGGGRVAVPGARQGHCPRNAVRDDRHSVWGCKSPSVTFTPSGETGHGDRRPTTTTRE